jgi:energy-coupling factor transporter ATP-binding protein EcfA2
MEPEQPFIARSATGNGFAFSRAERERHLYVVGKSGSGKTTLLANLALLDIMAGEGVVVVDPLGHFAEAVTDCIPPDRTNEVCYIDVADDEAPIGINVFAGLAGASPHQRALAASGVHATFKHVWRDSWGARLSWWLLNGITTLTEYPGATLLDLPPLFTNDTFRERVLRHVSDRQSLRFWSDEFEPLAKRDQLEYAMPLLNKAGSFAHSPRLRAILGQRTPKFDLETAVNRGQIVIANLGMGRIGAEAASLLGSLLVSHLQLAILSRVATKPAAHTPVFAYVDEVHSVATDAFASLLSQARNYSLHFTLANQYMTQLSDEVRAAVIGNNGAIVAYRVSSDDAKILAPEFHPLQRTSSPISSLSMPGCGASAATAASLPHRHCSGRKDASRQ